MIIGVTGYGATGASAYIDLLMEFEGVQAFTSSVEFQLLQQPDGICDLKYYLTHAGRRLSSSCMLKRYKKNILNSRSYVINGFSSGKYKHLTSEYFDQLVQIKWKGKSAFDPTDFRPFYDTFSLRMLNRVINKVLKTINSKYAWPPAKDRYFSYLEEEEFDKITSKYLNALLEACGFSHSSPIILEQIFNTTHPTEGMEYFADARSIIVDRDPRDAYIISNVTARGLCGFMPNSGKVEDFVAYYRSLHKPRSMDPRVMYVQFEDLLFDYEKTIDKVADFVGLNHVKKGEFFKPECSINNTQQYLNYPELQSDIKYIEEHLADMLYPFEDKKANITYVPKQIKAFDRQIEANRQMKAKRKA